MAATGDERITAATLFTTQVDFTHAGDLKVFVDEDQIADLETEMNEERLPRGLEDGDGLQHARPNDLIWPYVVSNYFKGKEPGAFDLLYWNADATRMPAANHSFYLRNCYLENNLTKGGMVIGGATARPRQGEDPDLQSRDARGPHRPGALGVLRLVLFRREGDVRARRLRPHRRASSIRRRAANTSTGPGPRRKATTTRTGSPRPKNTRAPGGRIGRPGSSRTMPAGQSRGASAAARSRRSSRHPGAM